MIDIIMYLSGFLFLIGLLTNIFNDDEQKIIEYFLRREVGTVDNISAITHIHGKKINQHISTLIQQGKIRIIMDNPTLYKWTEDRDYPEGMVSQRINIRAQSN